MTPGTGKPEIRTPESSNRRITESLQVSELASNITIVQQREEKEDESTREDRGISSWLKHLIKNLGTWILGYNYYKVLLIDI